MKKKIFIACDTNNTDKAKKIIKSTKTNKIDIGYKFGIEFFYSKYGRSFISKLDRRIPIWIDLKLMDIPNTVGSAIVSLKDLRNIDYITVHISGGLEMMRIAKKKSETKQQENKSIGCDCLD